MVLERTSVGLDVHARSIVAGVIDGHTREIRSERLAPTTEAVAASSELRFGAEQDGHKTASDLLRGIDLGGGAEGIWTPDLLHAMVRRVRHAQYCRNWLSPTARGRHEVT
jgi:hypothetical protein